MALTTKAPPTADSVDPARGRLLGRIRLRSLNGRQTLGLVVLLVVLVYLIVGPLGVLIWGSFQNGSPGAGAGATLSKYKEAYGSASIYSTIGTTLIFAIASTIICVVIGGYLAWLTQRTNVRGKAVIYLAVIFPMALPSLLTSIAWALLIDPQIGVINHYASDVLGLKSALFNGYSLPGMIWVQSIEHLSLPFLLIGAALRSMDPSLEDASAASGAGSRWTTFKITLPMMRPVLLATALLVFLRSIEGYEVPLILGLPGRISILATTVWEATNLSPADYNLASAYSMAYMVIAVIGLVLYFRALRRSERFVSVTGKGFRPRVIDLGRSRWVHGVVGYLIAFVSAVLPVLMIVWMSLQAYFVVPDSKSFKTITGAGYSSVFHDSQFTHDFVNNIEIGVGCAVATTLLAAVISWIVVRGKWRGSKLLDTVAFLPVGIPGIVLGLAVLWMYLSIQGINNLYGTLFIIAFAFMAAALPTALRITHPGLAQVSDDLEEASKATGAGWFRTFFRVTLPVISGSLAAAFILTMTLTFKVLSVPMMLYSGGTETVPVYIYEQYSKGNYSGVAAAGVVLAAVLALLSGLSYLLSRRFGGMSRMET